MAKQILVVDDDRHIREVVQFALEKAGLEVIEAGDGQQALALFKKSVPALIVLDITMPEMDGLAVCREIRKSSDVPILFLSSRTDEVDRIVGLEIGGDDYVSKPFSPRELVARVQAILKRTGARQLAASEIKELAHGAARISVYGHAAYWKDKRGGVDRHRIRYSQILTARTAAGFFAGPLDGRGLRWAGQRQRPDHRQPHAQPAREIRQSGLQRPRRDRTWRRLQVRSMPLVKNNRTWRFQAAHDSPRGEFGGVGHPVGRRLHFPFLRGRAG